MNVRLCSLLILILTACQSAPHPHAVTNLQPAKDPSQRSQAKGLEQFHAAYRAQHVSDVSYNLDIDLMDSRPTSQLSSPDIYTHFNGKLVLEFDMDTPQLLTLDFHQGDIKSFIMNGEELSSAHYNGAFVEIPARALIKGRNQAIIIYRQSYSNYGAGLTKFTDKEDGNIYLYTQFEPYDANHLLPCFDQPDLKATFQLKVRAPSSWQVVSNTREDSSIVNGEARLWSFPKSPKMSPYVFSLHAGPYTIWKDFYNGPNGTIPLRLFARKALARYVAPKDWFKFTADGIKYYENYFGYPYPFKKYDQLIVPNFNYGAMENIAAVTFSEKYIVRGKVTEHDREKLAETLLHELSHMWFGDLVTMKWWNDLWLNESFATYMATKAAFEASGFKSAWQNFYKDKRWAYWTDQLVTTHPIEDQVDSTEQAFTNFDGITYGKGAAVLKQVNFLLGEKAFKTGLRKYFQTFAYSNTTRRDFTTTLAEAAKTSLDDWTSEWLQTSGVNTVETHWKCEAGKITSFEVLQTPDASPSPRTHKTELALYRINSAKKVILAKKQMITLKGHMSGQLTPVPEVIGTECPQMVHPNFGDQAYFKITLDKETLRNLPEYLHKIPEPLSRTQLWDALWSMVREAKLSLQDYIQIVIKNIPYETDEPILHSVLESLYREKDSVQAFLPEDSGFSVQAASLNNQIETLLWKLLSRSTAGSDLQKMLFQAYIASAKTDIGYQRLKSLLSGKSRIVGLKFDQDLRWEALKQLAGFPASEVDKWIEDEFVIDQSDWGRKNYMAARAARPSPEVKVRDFKLVTEEANSLPLGDLREIMKFAFPNGQDKSRISLAKAFYEKLKKLSRTKDSYFLEDFSEAYVPLNCTAVANNEVKNFLKEEQEDLPYPVIKALRVAIQEDERCQKIRGLAIQTSMSAQKKIDKEAVRHVIQDQ